MTTSADLPVNVWSDDTKPCRDPECAAAGGVAEPEGDGEQTWHECISCGYAFDYVRIDATSISGETGTCQVGVPEAVRRAASGVAENAQRQQAGPPLLQIGRRPTEDD